MQFTQWRGRIRWLGSIPTSGHSIQSFEAGGGRESGSGGREYHAGDRVGCRELAIDLGLYMRESCLFITWNRSRSLGRFWLPKPTTSTAWITGRLRTYGSFAGSQFFWFSCRGSLEDAEASDVRTNGLRFNTVVKIVRTVEGIIRW
jgi:hypothetical protein